MNTKQLIALTIACLLFSLSFAEDPAGTTGGTSGTAGGDPSATTGTAGGAGGAGGNAGGDPGAAGSAGPETQSTPTSTTPTTAYQDWADCAQSQQDANLGYECFDEFNECAVNSPDSTGLFYSQECADDMKKIQTCFQLNSCASKQNLDEQETCIKTCKREVDSKNQLVKGYVNCWLNCANNWQSYLKRQPRGIENAVYDTCLIGSQSICPNVYDPCMKDEQCKSKYDRFFKKVLSCCFNDGRYDHYTDSWSTVEIHILEFCISEAYNALYEQSDSFKNALKAFSCYLDCTVANNNFYKNSAQQLQDLQTCVVDGCNKKLNQEDCRSNQCKSSAYAAYSCIRMRQGQSDADQSGLTMKDWVYECILGADTMDKKFNQQFAYCVSNQVCNVQQQAPAQVNQLLNKKVRKLTTNQKTKN